MIPPYFSIRLFGPAVLVLMLFTSSVFAGCSAGNDDSSEDQAATAVRPASPRAMATIETVCTFVEWAEPMWKKEVLVSEIDQLFFAKVRSMGGTIRGGGVPYVRTPFTVEVEQRLLGDAEGTITVIQDGGYDMAYDHIVKWACDPLLELGTTYLLAAYTDSNAPNEENRYRLVAKYGTIRVQNDAHRQRLIDEYTEAIEVAALGS